MTPHLHVAEPGTSKRGLLGEDLLAVELPVSNVEIASLQGFIVGLCVVCVCVHTQ